MKLKQFLMDHRPTPAFVPVVMILLLMLALVGCAGNKPKPDFEETPVEVVVKVPYECGQPSPVPAVSMRDIRWEIIEVENIVLNEGDEPFTGELYTLSVDDYKALGLNTSDWIAASAGMRGQRDFYRLCIERSQKDIHDENLDARMDADLPR